MLSHTNYKIILISFIALIVIGGYYYIQLDRLIQKQHDTQLAITQKNLILNQLTKKYQILSQTKGSTNKAFVANINSLTLHLKAWSSYFNIDIHYLTRSADRFSYQINGSLYAILTIMAWIVNGDYRHHIKLRRLDINQQNASLWLDITGELGRRG